MVKAFLKRGLALLGLATSSCAGLQQTAPPAARPALWEVADQDTRIYLFGTIHMLPQRYRWRTPAFNTAVAKSQVLVVETIVDEANPQKIAMELARLGFRQGLPPLTDRVPPEKRQLLEEAIKRTGAPRSAFDMMETWAAAFMILGPQFNSLGITGGEGVEATLRLTFKASGKPLDQLETNAEQLGFFDALPEKAQRSLLEGAIEAPTAFRAQFDQMLAAWARGDVPAIARTFNEDLAESPELMDALIKRRNANWRRWIERRMAQPGTIMVAVGAGHLAGSGSVIDLMEKDGYRVKRVQ